MNLQRLRFVGFAVAVFTEKGGLAKARETLIRQMRVRFGELPEETVAIIQAESDQERLDTWLDRFATAESLEEVGIGS